MRRLVASLLLAGGLLLAPAAHAGQLSLQSAARTVTFSARAGESNRLTVSQSGSLLTVEDTAADLSLSGISCDLRHSSTSAECSLPSGYRVHLNLGDRDDRLSVRSQSPVTVAGGAGNDVVTGGGGADAISGEAGNDTLDGGAGADDVSGGDGDDVLKARDLVRDVLTCGLGADRLESDVEDAVATDCEGVASALAPAPLGGVPVTTDTTGTTPAPGSAPAADGAPGATDGEDAVPALTGVPLPGLPDPRPGRDVALGVKEGRALVRLPGATAYVPVEAGRRLPVGSSVDAREGVVSLVAARDLRGGRQAADFTGAVFTVAQRRGRRMTTVLRLRGGDFSSCSRAGRATARAAQAPRRRPVRRLWGSGHGRFTTRGRNATATVRGTVWSVTDSCAGTTTRVERGLVAVRDLVRGRTRLVRAGRSWLVRPARARR